MKQHTQPLVQPVDLGINTGADRKFTHRHRLQSLQQHEQFGMQHDTGFRRDDLRSLTLIKASHNTACQPFQMKGGAPPAMQRHGIQRAHLVWPDIGAFEKPLDLRLLPRADRVLLPMLKLTAATGRKGCTGWRAALFCRFDQLDHPGADALRIQAQRLCQHALTGQAGRNKDHMLPALMIMRI